MNIRIYCFAIFLIIGCKNEEKGSVKHDFRTIKVSFSNIKEVLSTDIIDSIQYIKLEDTKEPIGEIEKMIVEDDKIILLDASLKCIWVFDSKGLFIGRISKFGRGPEEYASIYNISFTAPNMIHVIDGATRSVKTYSTTGEFISQEKTYGNIFDYMVFQKQKYIYYYYSFPNVGPKYYFNVYHGDNAVTGFFEYNKPFLFVGNGGDFILKNDDLCYLRLPYNDTIYSVDNADVTAKYVFDFGKNRYPSRDIYKAKSLEEVDRIVLRNKYEGNISNVIISKKHIVLNFHQENNPGSNQKTATLIYNMESGATCTYNALLKGKHEIMLDYPLASDGKYFYFPRNSFELPEQIIKRQHSEYNENSNPTIIKYKYKI